VTSRHDGPPPEGSLNGLYANAEKRDVPSRSSSWLGPWAPAACISRSEQHAATDPGGPAAGALAAVLGGVSNAAALAERRSMRQTRTTGRSLSASSSRNRRKLDNRHALRIGHVAGGTVEFVATADVDDSDAAAVLEPACKLIYLDPPVRLTATLPADEPCNEWHGSSCTRGSCCQTTSRSQLP
jgi:hypothetical protein